MNRIDILENCLRGLTIFEDRFDQVSSKDADWIIQRLAWHKVLPLAAAVSDLQTSKCDPLEHCFEQVIMKNTIQETHYEQQVKAVFQLLADLSIDFIPYKGPFWCHRIYPDYAWRHIGDIDLMMNINDARKASAILQEQGYIPDIMEGTEDDDFVLRGELTLLPHREKKHLVPVQIHWNPLPSPRFVNKQFMPADFFRHNARPAIWKDIRYLLPPAEIQFFYYILHATCQHQFLRFSHILAPIHLIRKTEVFDWSFIENLILRQQVQTPFYYGLKFIQTFFPLPDTARRLLNRLRPDLISASMAMFLKPSDTLTATRKRGRWRRELFRVAMSRQAGIGC